MKQENVNYFVVGVFVLSLLGFFMIVVYKVSSEKVPQTKYKVSYTSIMGLKKGSKVSYQGSPVGSVTNIEPIHKDGVTTFEVEISVNKAYRIPTGSIAQIVTPNFLSEQQIDIREVKSDSYLKEGGTIIGKQEVSFMTMLNQVAQEVQQVSNDSVQPLLNTLRDHIDKIGKKLSVQIPQIAENTNKLLMNLNQGADHLNRILGSENQKYVRNILMNADKMSAKFYQMSDKLDLLRVKLAKMIQTADKMLESNRQDVRLSVVAVRKSLETIANRINIIVYNIEQTSRNFSEFSRKIRQNPGSILGGKSPKEQGVLRR